jgi:hypothetical protein
MSILWVRRKTTSGSRIDDRGQQSFRSEYTAKSNRANELRSAVLNCGLVPVYGSPHPENMAAVCTGVSAERHRENPFLWDIAAEWQVNPPSRRDPADQQKPPGERRAKWSLSTVAVPVQVFIDYAGQLLASSAGQPFDPAHEMNLICDQITIQRYETNCDRPWQRTFIDRANEEVWLGHEIGTALVESIDVQEEYTQGAYWFVTTYKIIHKPRMQFRMPHGTDAYVGGWAPEFIADVGTLQWAEVDGKTKLVAITRIDPITKKPFYDGRPAFLNGEGKELPRDDNGIYTADPVIRQFAMKRYAKFAAMQLTPPPGMNFAPMP